MQNPPTNLEDMLRELAARGEISHISVVPSQNGKKFRASFAMCSLFGASYAEDADPVKAIMVACSTAKMKPQRASKRPMAFEGEATRMPDEDPAADLM